MDNIGYSGLMESLFHSVVDAPGEDLCGEAGNTVFRALSERMDRDTYFDLEDQISAGFRENAYNGFCSGFRCAALLLLGDRRLPDVQGEAGNGQGNLL